MLAVGAKRRQTAGSSKRRPICFAEYCQTLICPVQDPDANVSEPWRAARDTTHGAGPCDAAENVSKRTSCNEMVPVACARGKVASGFFRLELHTATDPSSDPD